MNRLLPRALMAPAVVTLLLWSIVPLLMTLHFSFVSYNLMQPGEHPFAGLSNFEYFVTDPDFWPAVGNTLVLIGSVIGVTLVGGVLLALLVNDPFPGQGIVRVLLISPFFVMPAVNALLWKHMMMNPIYGVLANVWKFFGAEPVDWLPALIIVFTLSNLPIMVWMLYTNYKEIPAEILEAARMDGANLWTEFREVVLPLSVGGLASCGLLCLVLSWNEAFWALNLTSAKAGTLATLIASYSSPEGLFWAKLSAASLMAIAPIVVFGWFSQKQLVQGLTFGAVK
jgi:ABC-type sugar transport system permease subunit